MRKFTLYYFSLILYIVYVAESLAQLPVQSDAPVLANQTKKKEKISFDLFPHDQLYPDYIANPLRSTFSAQTMFFDKTSIANTSRRRFDLKIGGRFGIFRRQSATNQKRAWQLTFEGGFHGQFDADKSEDNIGWDGIYALSIDVRSSDSLAYRFGVHHISSHIGDELAERTGRTRINYTRQETRAGISWMFLPSWQTYAEIAWGHDLRNKTLQKPWRAELGLQYEKPRYFFEQLGWYTALDLSSYEENNWDINTALQFGLVSARDERSWRLGFEYYDGRAQLGEFFQDNEQYVGLAFWIDI